MALYKVTYNDLVSYYVNSADATSMKKPALRRAYAKARAKAAVKRKKAGLGKAAVAAVNCVG